MEMYLDRTRQLIKPIQDKGIPVTFHSDGKIDQIIDMLVELGFCAMHPVEPYSNDIYEVKQKVGNRLCIMGNIRLTSCTADDVQQDTREHIEKLADGGYVLTSSHTVTDDVPIENFKAMVETNYDLGSY